VRLLTLLVAVTGLRIGELLALRWKHILLDRELAAVCRRVDCCFSCRGRPRARFTRDACGTIWRNCTDGLRSTSISRKSKPVSIDTLSEYACAVVCLREARESDPFILSLGRSVHATPTAESLRTWLSIPVPATPPDVFITYLFRGAPRFVVNQARVCNLTNILGG
jgi:hypothetical protein